MAGKDDKERVWIAFSTVDQEEKALHFARQLVERKLAACVNIVPGARSLYHWRGKICDEKEFLLIIKTTKRRFSAIQDSLKELHPYEVPELIACEIADGHAPYLAWVKEQTK